MPSGVVQKLPSTVTKNAGRLEAVPNVWTINSKVPVTDGCGCPLDTQFAGGSRPRRVSSNQRVADSNLKLLCKCQRRSLFNVPFVFVFRLLKTDVAQQLQVV